MSCRVAGEMSNSAFCPDRAVLQSNLVCSAKSTELLAGTDKCPLYMHAQAGLIRPGCDAICVTSRDA